MTLLADVLLASLAAVWLWYVLNLPAPPLPLRLAARALRALPRGSHLVGCPWCLGAHLSFVSFLSLSYAHQSLDWVTAPVGALASAGVTGLIGTALPDDGEPT